MTVNGHTDNVFLQRDRERKRDNALVARLVAELNPGRTSPWLNAKEAAAYLRCPLSRVRKLTMQSILPVNRDGRRCLYHTDDLDTFIRNGGVATPASNHAR